MLQEWSITDTLDSNGSLSKLGIPLSATSKYVTYWPSIIYQTSTGDLQEIILYNGWHNKTTGHTALAGSALVEIPFQADYPNGGNHLFYQQDDGTLVSTVGSSSANWSTGMKPPPTVSFLSGLTPRPSRSISKNTQGISIRRLRAAGKAISTNP
jgi:hypothetical protein